MPKTKRILYFIRSFMPTAEERAEALLIGTRMFRNASVYQPGDSIEPCDAVAGSVPKAYLARFPRATPPTTGAAAVNDPAAASPAAAPAPSEPAATQAVPAQPAPTREPAPSAEQSTPAAESKPSADAPVKDPARADDTKPHAVAAAEKARPPKR